VNAPAHCTIVDYGMGNLGSIGNMLKKIGATSSITHKPDDILGAERLILPGVGAFTKGMSNLRERGLIPALEEAVLSRQTPLLGICLGMHLIGRSSEEGEGEGLGWVPADCIKFRAGEKGKSGRLKVPNMGWNQVAVDAGSKIFSDWEGEARFYFVHSYYLKCDSDDIVAATARYGIEYAAAIEMDNIFAVQFHPEKSHRFGMRLLRRFLVI